MRITGGELGGRNLKVPKSDLIRPTQDRVREALFNSLQFELVGKDFLDLFAGSGAVGIEALSRGAKSATFVEQDRRHLAVLKDNLSAFALSSATVISADVYRYLANYAGAGFDFVFADPPYALGEAKGYAPVLATLAERGVVRVGGLFLAEMTSAQKTEEAPGWTLTRERTYGKTRLAFYRRNI